MFIRTKKVSMVLLIVYCFTTLFSLVNASSIRVAVNEKIIDISGQELIIKEDRALISTRFISEQLNYDISWEEDSREVIITDFYQTVIIQVDSHTIKVLKGNSSRKYNTDVPVIILEGRVLVPLRVMSEILDFGIEWDADKGIIHIYEEIIGDTQEDVVEDDMDFEHKFKPYSDYEIEYLGDKRYLGEFWYRTNGLIEKSADVRFLFKINNNGVGRLSLEQDEELGDSAYLTDLIPSEGELYPDFDPNIKTYTLTLPEDAMEVTVEVVPEDINADIERTTDSETKDSLFNVTAENKINTKQYRVKIIREGSEEVLLPKEEVDLTNDEDGEVENKKERNDSLDSEEEEINKDEKEYEESEELEKELTESKTPKEGEREGEEIAKTEDKDITESISPEDVKVILGTIISVERDQFDNIVNSVLVQESSEMTLSVANSMIKYPEHAIDIKWEVNIVNSDNRSTGWFTKKEESYKSWDNSLIKPLTLPSLKVSNPLKVKVKATLSYPDLDISSSKQINIRRVSVNNEIQASPAEAYFDNTRPQNITKSIYTRAELDNYKKGDILGWVANFNGRINLTEEDTEKANIGYFELLYPADTLDEFLGDKEPVFEHTGRHRVYFNENNVVPYFLKNNQFLNYIDSESSTNSTIRRGESEGNDTIKDTESLKLNLLYEDKFVGNQRINITHDKSVRILPTVNKGDFNAEDIEFYYRKVGEPYTLIERNPLPVVELENDTQYWFKAIVSKDGYQAYTDEKWVYYSYNKANISLDKDRIYLEEKLSIALESNLDKVDYTYWYILSNKGDILDIGRGKLPSIYSFNSDKYRRYLSENILIRQQYKTGNREVLVDPDTGLAKEVEQEVFATDSVLLLPIYAPIIDLEPLTIINHEDYDDISLKFSQKNHPEATVGLMSEEDIVHTTFEIVDVHGETVFKSDEEGRNDALEVKPILHEDGEKYIKVGDKYKGLLSVSTTQKNTTVPYYAFNERDNIYTMRVTATNNKGKKTATQSELVIQKRTEDKSRSVFLEITPSEAELGNSNVSTFADLKGSGIDINNTTGSSFKLEKLKNVNNEWVLDKIVLEGKGVVAELAFTEIIQVGGANMTEVKTYTTLKRWNTYRFTQTLLIDGIPTTDSVDFTLR